MNQSDTDGFPWERVLEALFPIYDGSMTRLLEHCFQSRVQMQILFQAMHPLERRLAALRLDKGGLVIEQRVLLVQEETGKNLLFAASVIVPAIFPPSILQGIQQQDAPQPLGRIVQNVPVCRQILACKERPAGALLADSLGVGPQAACCARLSLLRFDERLTTLIKEVILLSRTLTGAKL